MLTVIIHIQNFQSDHPDNEKEQCLQDERRNTTSSETVPIKLKGKHLTSCNSPNSNCRKFHRHTLLIYPESSLRVHFIFDNIFNNNIYLNSHTVS